MNNSYGKIVLITGASSGIGKAAAELLSKNGFIVYGTSRKCKEIIEQSAGYHLLKMDVCDEQSIQSAVHVLLEREGKIDILINNAGIGIAGSIEDMLLSESYQQMDTNFFGYLRVIRAVLPVMRKHGKGLIINISSVAGFISIPYQALYSASKYAVEAITEALRIEVKAFGVNAVLIEPGDTKTGFTNSRVLAKALSGDSAYKEASLRSVAKMEKDEQKGCDPEIVAKTILKVIGRKKPPIRIIVGFDYKLIYFLKKILPSRLIESIIGSIYG